MGLSELNLLFEGVNGLRLLQGLGTTLMISLLSLIHI